MSTSTDLLTLETGGGYEVLDVKEELCERSSSHEKTQNENVVIISGTITVSP